MPYVYRYKDLFDNRIKYVGIVKGEPYKNLIRRIKQHRKDIWFKNSEYYVDYIEVPTRSDAEAIESSLIAKYESYKFYNKAKSNWGESSLFEIEENRWEKYGVESLQTIYRESVIGIEQTIYELIKEKKAIEERNKLLSAYIITNGICTVNFKEIKQSLSDKIDLYDSYSADCATRATADKWAYRANKLRSALAILECELLENHAYDYSKEYKEDYTQHKLIEKIINKGETA